MRRLSAVALLLFCGAVSGMDRTDLPGAMPSGVRGMVPLESTELALAPAESGFWAVFTGLTGRTYAVYARRYDGDKGGWQEAVRLSQDGQPRESRPALVADSGGDLHCAWLSRLGKGKYAILYSRLERGSSEWATAIRFEGGKKDSHPRVAADGDGRVFVYSELTTDEAPWGKIGFWVSGDRGRTWKASSPNYPEGVKKGKASDPFLELGEGGRVWLAWLDQTPGGRSVVVNRSDDGGRTWLDRPLAVNSDKRFSLSNPALVASGGSLHVFWTVSLLEASGRTTELWTDRSSDGGITWTGNRRFQSEPVSDVTWRFYRMGHDIECVWSGRGRDSGVLFAVPVWRNENPADAEATKLLEESASFVNNVSVVRNGDEVAVFFSNRDAFDAGRVGVFQRVAPGAAWVQTSLSRSQSATRAAAPAAIVDGGSDVYTLGYHEVRRRPLIGAPEIWDSSLIFAQFKLQHAAGDEG